MTGPLTPSVGAAMWQAAAQYPGALTETQRLRLAELLADSVRDRWGLLPPIDVQGWCRRAGVELRWARIVEEGHYLRGAARATVRVRPGGTSGRRNFTVAHELGHHFLEEARREPGFRRSLSPLALRWLSRVCIGGPDEERVCDAFAAALLVPATAVVDLCRSGPVTLHSLHELAGKYSVSVQMAALRVEQATGMTVLYLSCSRQGALWHVDDCVGAAGRRWRGSLIRLPALAPASGVIDAWWLAAEVIRVRLEIERQPNDRLVAFMTSSPDALPQLPVARG